MFQPPPHAFITLERLCSQLMVKLDRCCSKIIANKTANPKLNSSKIHTKTTPKTPYITRSLDALDAEQRSARKAALSQCDGIAEACKRKRG